MMELIKNKAKRVGIQEIGVTKARVFNELAEINSYFSNDRRVNPFLIMPNAKSIIVCLFPYPNYAAPGANIAKYARVHDYHTWVEQKLTLLANEIRESVDGFEYKVGVDNTPLPDKYLAYLSSLSFFGKNTLAINKTYGSFFFIGYILCNLSVDTDNTPLQNKCGSCNLCISSCPSNALSENGLDRKRCISYLTQKRGDLSDDEISLLKKGAYIWGCDICADVCPHNKKVCNPGKYDITFLSENDLSEDNFHKYSNFPFYYKGNLLKVNFKALGSDQNGE